MSFRKFHAHLIQNEHSTYVGHYGELSVFEGELYIHDGETPGGSLISASGSGGSYTLPTASTVTKGGVKLDGTSITINGSGVIGVNSVDYSKITNAPTVPSAVSQLTNDSNFITLASVTWNNVSSKPSFATVATSGSYNDLTNKPSLFSGSYADLSGKPTLFSGSYNDLTNKPSLFDGAYASLTGKPTLFSGAYADLTGKPTYATVATSGSYNDLTNKPSLFSGSYNDLTNRPTIPAGQVQTDWNAVSGMGEILNKPSLSTVATSGAYADLTGKPSLFSGAYADLTGLPTLFSGAYADLTGKPSLAAVATSGSYNDLSNRPSIPAEQVQTDWNAVSGMGVLLNKPNLSTVATSGSYNDLTNKPSLFNGDYESLTNKPSLFSGAYADLTGKPSLFSGNYNDLTNAPTIPSSLLDLGIVDGSYGQVLTTDGAGAFTFTTVATGSLNPRDVTRVYAYVTNADSATIHKGDPVYMYGATGNRVSVKLASNSGESLSSKTLGLADQDIAPGNPGYICVHGVVDSLDTSMFSEGDVIYLGSTPGTITNVKPYAPNHLVYLGTVQRANQGNGQIVVRPQNGYELQELHNVDLTSVVPSDGYVLTYNASTQLWTAQPISVPTNLSQLTNDSGFLTSETQSDWNEIATESPAYIWNKPTIPADIADLTDNSNLLGGSSPTNAITNTDGVNTWAVSVASTGVITMNTGRGGLEFGAMPEVGAPNHLHIMRPAGQEGSTDLFFGDDHNYVRLPGLYGGGTQGVEIGSSFNNGALSTWRFGTDGHLVPGFDNLQDIGSPTARVRHIYVGPGSITIGDSVLSESATGKLVVPGVTRATALHANEVEDTGDQTYQFAGLPNLLDNIEFMNRNGQYTPSGSYVPAVYQADALDGEGYVDGISVVSGGTWTQAEADSARNNQMWATTNPDPYTSWNAGDWFQIPFVVRARADDVEYEFSTGGSPTRLENLTDVNIDTPTNGQALLWDSNNEYWYNGTPSGGGSSNALTNGYYSYTLDGDGYLRLNYDGSDSVLLSNREGDAVLTSLNGSVVLRANDNTEFYFRGDGKLQLPPGGDITDSNGNSVLGGGSGSTNSLVNGDFSATLESDGTLTVPGNIVAAQTGFGFNSIINNISLDGTDVYVNLADNVFPGPVTGEVTISGVTGATEANGVWGYEATDPGQFRLYTDSSRSTLVDGSAWGSYASGGTAVAGTSNDLGITVGSKQWAFNTSGDLVLPAGGDIKDSNGNSVLGSSSSTPGISNGTFSTLPNFLDFYSGTSLRAGQNENGVFFSGDADGDPMGPGSGNISYPIRTNFTISGTTKVVVTLDMVVNAGCSDFGLCVFEDGTQPQWNWGTDSTRIAAQYNCVNPQIQGLTSGNNPESYELSGNGTYRVRFTYQPGVNPDVRLETLDTNDNVLDTVEYAESLNTGNSYRIGFAADQDSENKRTYIKNLTINVGDGQELYTNSLQLAGASDTTKTWTNPNGNTWRIEEYSGGWAGGYNYPSASISYTVTESQTDVNYFAIDTAAFPSEWQAVQWATNFTINGQTIGYGGYGFAGGSTYNVSLQSNVTYNVGDVITINYGDQNQNPVPSVWWDANNSPSGNNNFRGAIIEYHAYTDAGTAIGKIIISADDQDNVTHMESMSGGSDMSQYEFWYAPGYGQLAVRRVGTDANNNDNSIMIQWTGKIFYGNEYWC